MFKGSKNIVPESIFHPQVYARAQTCMVCKWRHL